MKDILEKKLKEAEYLITKAEKSLKKAPEGTLVLSQSNGSAQYFHKTKNEQKKENIFLRKIENSLRRWHRKIMTCVLLKL